MIEQNQLHKNLSKRMNKLVGKDIAYVEDLVNSVELMRNMVQESETSLQNQVEVEKINLEASMQSFQKVTNDKLKNFDFKIASIKSSKDGRDGLDGLDGVGIDGRDGRDGRDGSPDTPDQIIGKVNTSGLQIKKERVEGLVDAIRIAIANSNISAVPVTTSFFNGLRAKNLNIVGATAYQQGDTVYITGISGSGGGTGFTGTILSETPQGLVDGINTAYTTTSYIVSVLGLWINGEQITSSEYTITGPGFTMNTPLDASLSGADFTIVYTATSTVGFVETPQGAINSSNKVYTTQHTITTVIGLWINNEFVHPSEYTVMGASIVMVTPLDSSLSGTTFLINYV